MGSNFDFIFSIFPIIFMLALIVIIFVIIKNIREWARNNKQPVVPASAEVVSKRTSIFNNTNGISDTDYYVTFQFVNKDRMELWVPYSEYGHISEGDTGTLYFQGTRFIGFEQE